MTSRDAQLKAYREYQEALREAKSKEPKYSCCKISVGDGSEEIEFFYDHVMDELFLTFRMDKESRGSIPGKYLKSFQAALNSLIG
jgi:hypothetical protein